MHEGRNSRACWLSIRVRVASKTGRREWKGRMTDYSKIRQRLSQLLGEEQILVEGMMRPPKMVRGSITWHKKQDQSGSREGLYPGLNRVVGGKSIGRRVRIGHMEWLEPLLDAYRSYRRSMQRLRGIHKEMGQLVERLRYEHMYDYEATVPGHLSPVAPEGEDGQR